MEKRSPKNSKTIPKTCAGNTVVTINRTPYYPGKTGKGRAHGSKTLNFRNTNSLENRELCSRGLRNSLRLKSSLVGKCFPGSPYTEATVQKGQAPLRLGSRVVTSCSWF